MRLLLDTHALLWWLDDPRLLSEEARNAIKSGENIVYVSAAVIWEIVIKKALGKLDIPSNIERALATNGFSLLSITVPHALAVQKLPSHHRDPFDRMLIAQALQEGLILVSRDPNILKYRVAHMVA